MSAKVHLAVRGLGCPVRFVLTASHQGDAPQAEALLADLPADVVLADAAYDSDRLRLLIADKGATAVIPNTPSQTRKHALDRDLYKERHLIECCFAKLKQFRRVATRYEKTARNYQAVLTLAAIVLWIRHQSTPPSASSWRRRFHDDDRCRSSSVDRTRLKITVTLLPSASLLGRIAARPPLVRGRFCPVERVRPATTTGRRWTAICCLPDSCCT